MADENFTNEATSSSEISSSSSFEGSPSPVSSVPSAAPVETATPKKNDSLGLAALIIAILGLLLIISVFGIFLGIPLLVIALILGIIALCKTPRGKARASVIISALPLIMIGWLSYQVYQTAAPAILDFSTRIITETEKNPQWKAVYQSPGFEDFFENRVEQRVRSINRTPILANGGLKTKIQTALAYVLNEVKLETPLAIEAWIAQYGLPAGVAGELADTTRILREFDGQPVNGNYILTFAAADLSTQLCNTIGGNYTINGNTINGAFFQTEMACLDEERTTLEAAFQLDGATFSLASTRMAGDNNERLAITTPTNHTFLYTKWVGEAESHDTIQMNTPEVEDQNLIGGAQDEHGCYTSAGYSWNEEAQECQRPREQTTTPQPSAEALIAEDDTATAIENVQEILNTLDETN